MALALLWMTSASLLTLSTAMATDDLPRSCTWLFTVLGGCADDSFTFPDFTGWGLLQRHFDACLYIRGDTTQLFDCREPERFTTIVSCKMEAYMNAKISLKQDDHKKGNLDFKTCLTNMLDHYRANQTEGNTIEVGRTVEVELASHGNYSHGHSPGGAQDHNASRPNITIEYTHHL